MGFLLFGFFTVEFSHPSNVLCSVRGIVSLLTIRVDGKFWHRVMVVIKFYFSSLHPDVPIREKEESPKCSLPKRRE